MKARNYVRLALAVFPLVMAATRINATLVVNCPSSKTVDCSSDWILEQPIIVSNSCSDTNVSISYFYTATTNCPPVITRSWIFYDACSSNFCNQTVTLTNPVPLVLTCASDKTVNCGSPWDFDPPTITGGCGVTLSNMGETVTGVCPRIYTRTWLATDPCKDSVTCSQSVTVLNTTPPVFQSSSQQNLVPNPGFETYSSCPGHVSELGLAAPWYQPTEGTPDFYNVCASALSGVSVPVNMAGNRAPHGGEGYAGEFAIGGAGDNVYREYLETPLQTPLVSGHIYEVSFYVSLAENLSTCAVDSLGAYFSTGPILQSDYAYIGYGALPFTAQVRNPPGQFLTSTTDWMLVQGTYTAAGGEAYLTIGNFYDDANTVTEPPYGFRVAYYYVDDVTVSEPACPTNKTVQCGDNWSFDTPTAFDACSGADVPVTIQSTVTNGTCPQLITRIWLATDGCGNTNTCSQTVTVQYTPVILCPPNIVVTSCTNIGVDYSVMTTNVCCTNLTVVYTPPSGSVFAPGTVTNVHCVVTDCCSNSASCDFTVSVVEAEGNVHPTYGAAPLAVTFAVQTPCPTNIVNWRWNFGNGDFTNFTMAMNVSYTYTNPGIYTPILITKDTGGIDITNILPNVINVVSSYTAWQVLYFNCTNCLVAAPNSDPFGKGISNTNQFLAGLDPTNTASLFKIVSMVRSTNDVVITWKTAGVRTNAVQVTSGDIHGGYSTNGFIDVSSPIIIGVTGDTTANFTDTGGATNRSSRYYRVRLVP